jgi:hypothetical protein
MRRSVRRTCIALAASAALVAPIAASTAGADDFNGPVNVYIGNITSTTKVVLFKNMTIVATASLCSVTVDDLSVSLRGSRRVRCPGQAGGGRDAWVEDSPDQDGLVNTYVGDIDSDVQVVLLKDVSIPVAADFCAGAADTLAVRLRSDRRARCVGRTTDVKRAWVEYSRR